MKLSLWILAGAGLLGLIAIVVHPGTSREGAERIRMEPSEWNLDVPPEPEAEVPVPEPEPEPFDIQELLKKMAEAIRNGEKDTLQSLLDELKGRVIPPEIPDEENAALVYQEAFDLLKEVKSTEEERAVYDKALEGAELTAEEQKILDTWLDRHKDVLDLFRKAADYPKCRFPLEYEKGFAMVMEHLGPMMQGSKILKLADERWAVLSMERAMRQEPVLISQLVSMVVGGVALDGVGELTGRLGDMVESGSADDLRKGLENSMLMEVWAAVKIFNSDPETVDELLGPGAGEFMKDPMRPQDAAYYVESMAELMDIFGRPYPDAMKKYAAFKEVRLDHAPWFAQGTKLVLPAYDGIMKNVAKAEAKMSMARAAMELDRYRKKHGMYPQTLDGFSGLPADPFTGKPFTYRVDGDGFVLESTGDVKWRRQR